MFGVNDNNNQAASNGAAIPHSQPPQPAPNPISGPLSHSGIPASAPNEPVSLVSNDELLDLKQKALSSLSPMVDKLQQTPEEKFKTLMMLIQASDNVSLVKEAYAAAEQIPDERARAQALIDVVNEINYFTSKQS